MSDARLTITVRRGEWLNGNVIKVARNLPRRLFLGSALYNPTIQKKCCLGFTVEQYAHTNLAKQQLIAAQEAELASTRVA